MSEVRPVARSLAAMSLHISEGVEGWGRQSHSDSSVPHSGAWPVEMKPGTGVGGLGACPSILATGVVVARDSCKGLCGLQGSGGEGSARDVSVARPRLRRCLARESRSPVPPRGGWAAWGRRVRSS